MEGVMLKKPLNWVRKESEEVGSNQESCETCRFFFDSQKTDLDKLMYHPLSTDHGLCRRHAPTHVNFYTSFPNCRRDGWCGDYEQIQNKNSLLQKDK